MRRKKWYLAGPMTGIAFHNFPAFIETAQVLRDRGYDIISPAELDDEDVREFALNDETGEGQCPNGDTWGDFLSRDVKVVADEVEGVMLMKDWDLSKGARLEAFVALSCGHTIKRYHQGIISKASPEYIMERITEELLA